MEVELEEGVMGKKESLCMVLMSEKRIKIRK